MAVGAGPSVGVRGHRRGLDLWWDRAQKRVALNTGTLVQMGRTTGGSDGWGGHRHVRPPGDERDGRRAPDHAVLAERAAWGRVSHGQPADAAAPGTGELPRPHRGRSSRRSRELGSALAALSPGSLVFVVTVPQGDPSDDDGQPHHGAEDPGETLVLDLKYSVRIRRSSLSRIPRRLRKRIRLCREVKAYHISRNLGGQGVARLPACGGSGERAVRPFSPRPSSRLRRWHSPAGEWSS